jgi:Tfp pilus assembly protein PilV
MFKKIKNHSGISLIEVLITTLVISLGLLAVASLQGHLVNDSRNNKVSSEARILCAAQIEELRDRIQMGVSAGTAAGTYNSILQGLTTETITGKNEIFTRSLCVENLPNTPVSRLCPANSPDYTGTAIDPDKQGSPRKRVVASCSWGTGGNDQTIEIESTISFDSVRNAITVSGEGASSVSLVAPSTNAGSSFDINDDTKVSLPTTSAEGSLASEATETSTGINTGDGQHLKVNAGGTTASIVYKCTGETASGSVPFIAFDVAKGLYTRRVNNQAANDFKEAIELAKSNNDNLFGAGHHSCTRKIRYNGGIILPIKGRVYNSSGLSATEVSVLGFNSSESGVFCVFSPTASTTASFPYFCYVGGNCNNGPIGTTATSDGISFTTADATHTNTIVTQCPYATSTTILANAYSSLGPGGWRGKIGLLGLVASSGNTNRTSCFVEGEDAATAREYYSLRTSTTTPPVNTHEGINKHYMCHDFLIVAAPTGNNSSPSCGSSVVGTLKLAHQIIRRAPGSMADFTGSITAAPNAVDLTVGKDSCHVITGTMPTGVTTPPTVTASNGGFECIVIGSNYECAGTSKVGTGITVASGATSCTVPTLTSSNNYGTSNTTLTCNLGGTPTPTTRNITVTVTPQGTGTVSEINITGTNADCDDQICTVPYTWTGTLSASVICNGTPSTVSGTSATISSTGTTASITLASCTAPTAPTTHTISGSITKTGTGTLTGLAVTSNPAGGSCSVTGTSYTCTSVPNTWVGTLTASGTCSGTLSAIPVSFAASTVNQTGNLAITCTAPTTYTVSGTIVYSSATAADLTSIATPCSFTNTAKTGYSCSVTSGSPLTLSIVFTDGTGANDRAVCFGSTIDTSSPATFSYTSVTANTTLNIGVKKGNSISCP